VNAIVSNLSLFNYFLIDLFHKSHLWYFAIVVWWQEGGVVWWQEGGRMSSYIS